MRSKIIQTDTLSLISWICFMQGVLLFLVSALTGSVFDAGYSCALFAIETQAPSVSASSPRARVGPASLSRTFARASAARR